MIFPRARLRQLVSGRLYVPQDHAREKKKKNKDMPES